MRHPRNELGFDFTMASASEESHFAGAVRGRQESFLGNSIRAFCRAEQQHHDTRPGRMDLISYIRRIESLQRFRNCYRPKARTQVAFSSRKSHLSLLSKSLRVFRNCSRPMVPELQKAGGHRSDNAFTFP